MAYARSGGTSVARGNGHARQERSYGREQRVWRADELVASRIHFWCRVECIGEGLRGKREHYTTKRNREVTRFGFMRSPPSDRGVGGRGSTQLPASQRVLCTYPCARSSQDRECCDATWRSRRPTAPARCAESPPSTPARRSATPRSRARTRCRNSPFDRRENP
jgi:hypothetical protein